ncbi:glyoxalase/bleomycin resistance protein/dioxygenase [Pandoraea terrae]|uniref:Aldoketomutase n=1 Tax=Pandoraea terrae TaxID=1537710 RepID=A0A5E4XWZ9_9BURK|nr:VOC family protein [Pandoraea terrae]VVE40896.1 glyoxalase/bleomycin resistance protein/dioxygenase [Pandoraea terrae]
MPKYIHSMIRVRELAPAIRFYTQGFGLRESHRLDFPSFTLVYLRDPESGFEIELTQNKGRTEPYDLGTGYGHMAFCTDDLDALRQSLDALGGQPTDIKSLSIDGEPVAQFFFVTDPDGYKIEVLKKAGHYV